MGVSPSGNQKVQQDVADILPDVPHLAELRQVLHGERHTDRSRRDLSGVRLPAAARPDDEDVRLRRRRIPEGGVEVVAVLHHGVLERVGQPPVMVRDRHGDDLLPTIFRYPPADPSPSTPAMNSRSLPMRSASDSRGDGSSWAGPSFSRGVLIRPVRSAISLPAISARSNVSKWCRANVSGSRRGLRSKRGPLSRISSGEAAYRRYGLSPLSRIAIVTPKSSWRDRGNQGGA